MSKNSRNSIEKDGWVLTKPEQIDSFQAFDCGNDDLNEYFKKDIIHHKSELLSEVYVFKEKSFAFEFPVALIDLCNDSVRRDKFKVVESIKPLYPEIGYASYPAVKITRFGVSQNFQGSSIGSFVLNMIKEFFVTDNRTACRFITVDAYNHENVIRFYSKNDFQFFNDKDKNRNTRSMFFDLKRIL